MKKSEVAFGIIRVPLDALAVSTALLLSYVLREESIDLIPGVQLLKQAESLPALDVYMDSFMTPGILGFIVLAAIFRLYSLRATLGAWQEAGRVIVTVLVWAVCIMGWYFLVQRELFYSRMLLLHAIIFITLFSLILRTCVLLLQRYLMRYGVGVYLVASVGDHPVAHAAQYTLKQDRRYEYVGHTPDLSSLKKLQTRCRPDLIVQTDPNPQSQKTIELINYCRSRHIGYAFLPPVFADVPHQLHVERLGMVPILCFQPTPLDGWGRVWKRIFDIIFSIVLLVCLSPILLLIALGVLLSNGWPILYVSKRVGERAEDQIPVLKFRSMIKDADRKKQELLHKNERQDGPLFKLQDDPRITSFGRFLRRFDLDELPQLINVLLGHMSLVGPRPHLLEEVEKYRSYERRVFAVRPGITGLAQVSGRSTLKFKEEMHLDLQYIEEWSLRFDLWILWRTIFVVIFKGTRG